MPCVRLAHSAHYTTIYSARPSQERERIQQGLNELIRLPPLWCMIYFIKRRLQITLELIVIIEGGIKMHYTIYTRPKLEPIFVSNFVYF